MGNGQTLKQAARSVLETYGLLKSNLFFVNNPERLGRIKGKAELMASIGSAEDIQWKETARKFGKERDLIASVLPVALKMFHEGKMDKRCFSKKHIKSIMMLVFYTSPTLKGGKKDDWIKE